MSAIRQNSEEYKSTMNKQWDKVTDGVAYPGDDAMKERIAQQKRRELQYDKFGIGAKDAL